LCGPAPFKYTGRGFARGRGCAPIYCRTRATMIGALIALAVVLVFLLIFYQASHKCLQGEGGILCKVWGWLV